MPDDFFYQEDIGIDQVIKNHGNGTIDCTSESLAIPDYNCIFVPTIENVKALYIDHGIDHLLDNITDLMAQEQGYLKRFRFDSSLTL